MAGIPDPYLQPWTPTWLEPAPEPMFGVDPAGFPVEPPPSPMQPGMGMPAEMVDQALVAPMPEAMPQDPYAGQPQPLDPYMEPPPGALVPGMGIPATMFDQAAALPPDAISGVGPYAPAMPVPPPDTRAPDDPYLWRGDPLQNPDQGELDAYVEDMAITDPAEFQRIQIKRAIAAQNEAATAELKASEENQRRMEANLQDRREAEEETRQKMLALDTQLEELSRQKIDPDRFMSSRSGGQRIAMLIGAIAGGIAGGQAGNRSGRNAFMEDLHRTIDRDVDAQKADLMNAQQAMGQRRGLLAEEFARTGNLYQATEAVRIAGYAMVRDQLLAQQQLRDPRGTQAFAIGRDIQAMQGRMQASRAAAEKEAFDRSMALREQRRKEMETLLKMREAEAAALKAAGAGGMGSRPADPLPPQSWYAKNKITTDGPQARAAYQDYAGKIRAAQAAHDSRGGARAVAPTRGAAMPAGQAAQAGAPAAPTTAPAPAAEVETYQSPDDWFEANAPASSDEDKKMYYFVDGKNGSETPPLKFDDVDDAKGFRGRLKVRKQMAVKASQVITLVNRLRDNQETWNKLLRAGPKWANINDADAQELRSVQQSLALDVIKANGMGVPTGKDVEMANNMVGGDPAGWQNIVPQLQRARETLQVEADSDWSTYAPNAASDPAYNRFRVLPTADPGWVAKVNGRGKAKVVGPEMGNDDPKQLKPVTVEGDAPNAARAAADSAWTRQSDEATNFLRASGYLPNTVPSGSSRADEGPLTLREEERRPLPQVKDFEFKGRPEAGDAFSKLRTRFVNAAANVDQYTAQGKESDYKAFKADRKLVRAAVLDVINADSELAGRHYDLIRDGLDDEEVATLAGEILRTGGK